MQIRYIFFVTCLLIGLAAELPGQDNDDHDLQNSNSPYLQRHQDHPVNWNRWGPEAFEKAKEENKLVLVSIGYSSSYWGHRMEEENYTDSEVAEVLNQQYVNVVVDRDLRPDILNLYSEAADLIGRQPAWPMIVVMTPDRKPIRIFSYRPKRIQGRAPGFLRMIRSLASAWSSGNKQMLAFSSVISNTLQTYNGSAPGSAPDRDIFQKARSELKKRYDSKHAGFGQGAKFPAPHNLLFLIQELEKNQHEKARSMLVETLDQMRYSALYDHLGSGFHRFTMDRQWTDPQFEKDLSTQALMILLYTRGYQLTEDALYRRTVDELVSFVRDRLMNDSGGAYSYVDATGWSSERDFFYTWTVQEIKDVLPKSLAEPFIRTMHVTEKGNYKPKHMKAGDGENALYPGKPVKKRAESLGMSVDAYREKMEKARRKLLSARQSGNRPKIDRRVRTVPNGMLIASLAVAGRVFEKPAYTDLASRVAGFVREHLWTGSHSLHRQHWKGEASGRAFLKDYAALGWGMIELHRATDDTTYLASARKLTEVMRKRFEAKGGGFFDTTREDAPALNRWMHLLDGEEPSANSIAAYALAQLGRLTGKSTYMKPIHRMGAAFSKKIAANPSSYTMFLQAYRELFREPFLELARSDVELKNVRSKQRESTGTTSSKVGNLTILQHSTRAIRDVLEQNRDRVRMVLVLAPS